ncbi:MAG: anti-phage deoxyguanosine triphosphatase [Aestuariibacter sp.]
MDKWFERRSQKPPMREGDHRSPYQRDKARILHSAAFRRLQSKTQVLGVGIGDFYRTRLTHSLEASQIGQGIAAQLVNKYPDLTAQLNLDATLIEALCLAHDIGHPPFGHGGEIALNFMMHQSGGFEGNGQTFRIITKLEPYTAQHGMDLSRRTVLGLVKYPNTLSILSNGYHSQATQDLKKVKAGDWHPPKGLFDDDQDAFDWLLAAFSAGDRQLFTKAVAKNNSHKKTQFKSFDCSIMELADDIAYGIHDLEDAIVMGVINQALFEQDLVTPLLEETDIPWFKTNLTSLAPKLFSSAHHERKDAIGALVNAFITHIEISTTHDEFESDILKYNAAFPEGFAKGLGFFKRFVWEHLIRKPEIQQLEYKGQQVVMELFTAFSSDPERLLPDNTRKRWADAEEYGRGDRIICDYISGMTDEFAARMHGNLFQPKMQSLQHGQLY